MGLVIHLDSQGSGTGTGWDGTVNTRNDLPVTIGSPVVGSIYLAKFPIKFGAGILSYTVWQSGLYIRDTDLGSLSDWRRLNTKVKFTDSEFAIVSSANTDKQVRFDSSGITGYTQRTLTFQDKDGTIALLSDVNDGNIISSTQWSRTNIPSTPLPNGVVANGFTFFDNVTDKEIGGTTSWDEYNIAYGIDLTLTGTSGTANINVAGVDYLATFNTSLAQTAQDWINTHKATLSALNIQVLYNGGSPLNANGNETIRFCASEANCNSVAITTLTGDLSGTRINFFTGVNAAAGDHVLIPYIGRPYENQRIHHTFRVNFEIATGSQQTLALSLRRFSNDTVVGSEIQIFRTPDEQGQQYVFETYTANSTDPFVEGGFYFALRNDSGVSVDILGDVGILLQQTFQKLLIFP